MAYIYGLYGDEGCGKDTAINHVRNLRDVHILSFSDILKDTIATSFSIDRNMLEGITDEDRRLRETKDEFWSSKLAGKGIFKYCSIITPRILMRYIGTELYRNSICQDFWVICLMRNLDTIVENNPNAIIIIKDVRFPNEASEIIKRGGKIIHNRKGPKPNLIQRILRKLKSILGLIHTSNYELPQSMISHTIENDGTKVELGNKLLQYLC